MPQPPPAHIPTGVKVTRLFLTQFCGGTAEEGTKPALPSTEADEEVAEDRECVEPVGEVSTAGYEELVGDGDPGEEREAVLDGERGDGGGGEIQGFGFSV